MIDRLPQDVHRTLAEIGRLARQLGTPAYLVGGAVRDHLLGRAILDVDVAVEGDAVVLALAAAEAVPSEVRVHERFGTACLRLASGRRVDLARTRRERYPAMAALPLVTPASLADDLVRRDFTVNSMALPIEAAAGTEPIDPSGGGRDLDDRLLRVHHPRSFLDDPTRIVRGVRFELRLGFRFEPRTERLALEAGAQGAVGLLTPERLGAEVELLFDEAFDPRPAWQRLADLGVLEAAGLRTDGAGTALLGRVHDRLADWHGRHPSGPRARRARALLTAVVLAEQPEDRPRVAARLALPVGRGERLEELLARLEQPDLEAHRAAAALEILSIEELVVVDVLGGRDLSERVAEHLRSQRDFELAIDGSTLLAHGFVAGPEIGRALRATRDARLDGLITAGEELGFALAVLRGENRGGESSEE